MSKFTAIDIISISNLPCLISAMVLDTNRYELLSEVLPSQLQDKQAFITNQSKIFFELSEWLQQQVDHQHKDKKKPEINSKQVIDVIKWLLSTAEESQLSLYFEQGGFLPSDSDEMGTYASFDENKEPIVTIIGAGISGIVMAISLKKAGIPFTILEKNSSLGGTWQQNTYPGCRVDVANLLYGYSFFSDYQWQDIYAQQNSIHKYLQDCVEQHDILSHIQFSTRVTDLIWQEELNQWAISVADNGDEKHTFLSQFVVSAVGQLDNPNMPEIPGIEKFNGNIFHSALWDHNVDIENKKVAIVGAAASAIQFAPLIAEKCESLTIYQRSPNWFHHIPHLKKPVPELQNFVMSEIKYYREFFRSMAFFNADQGFLTQITLQKNKQEIIESEENKNFKNTLLEFFSTYIEKDNPLYEKVIPDYPPGAKRILLDDGSWLKMLQKEQVELVTDKLSSIDEEGLTTNNGIYRKADVVICATGFTANEFLTGINVEGSKSESLKDVWHQSPRAYLGMSVPKMPNLFVMFGPNTNVVVNGSITFFSECQSRYITECIQTIKQQKINSVVCKESVYNEYNQWIDDGNEKRAWGLDSVTSWYKDKTGRVSQNWPYGCSEYWVLTKSFNLDDYIQA